MKKFLSLLIVFATMCVLLTGCLAKFECDLCGEELFGIRNEAEVLGQTVEYCNDCKGELDKLENGLNDLGEDLSELGQDLADGLSDLFGGN